MGCLLLYLKVSKKVAGNQIKDKFDTLKYNMQLTRHRLTGTLLHFLFCFTCLRKMNILPLNPQENSIAKFSGLFNKDQNIIENYNAY